MPILITGGAGYIGSHMAYDAIERGEIVVVLDNLSTGQKALVPPKAEFQYGDAGDISRVLQIVKKHKIDAVIHFAGSVVVPESVEQPLAYYKNNTAVSRNLIEACVTAGVQNFIFSSTAAVYGAARSTFVSEQSETIPINPYGRSKLMTEYMLADASRAFDFKYVALRYFNVAGCDPLGRTGQSTPNATHLIKRACQVALGCVPQLEIYGTNLPTRDGTGVRDYIHVIDLVEAHLLALKHLRAGGESLILNCGYGRGYSVREVIAAVEKISGKEIRAVAADARAGDPAELIADSSKLKSKFNWKGKLDDLEKIVSTAYVWEEKLYKP